MQRGMWKNPFKLLRNPKRLINFFLQTIARSVLTPPNLRVKLQKARGVKFKNPKSVFIGTNVYFDELRPQDIVVGKNVRITEGVKILTHYYDASKRNHDMDMNGKVIIKDNVFIGFNVIIASSVIIDEGAIIGANSVVTKDIGKDIIVGGVPAKIIGHRGKDTIPVG